VGSNPTLCTIIFLKILDSNNYATIVFTLVTEWFEMFLCISARSSSLKDRLHLKHFQTNSDMP